MWKYKIINKFLDNTFPFEINNIIYTYLLPNKNNYLKNIMKFEYQTKNSYYNIITQKHDECYNVQYYKNLIIQRCDICSHIIYISFKKKKYSYCNCYN